MNLLCVLIFFGYGWPHESTALLHPCGACVYILLQLTSLSFWLSSQHPSISINISLPFYPSGLYMSFWQGQFPLIVGNKDDRIPLPSSFKPSGIGYLMIVVGSGEVLGASEQSGSGPNAPMSSSPSPGQNWRCLTLPHSVKRCHALILPQGAWFLDGSPTAMDAGPSC